MEPFAWPIVALILGIIGLFLFKPQIRGLINRTEKVGKGWLQAKSPEDQLGPSKISEVDDFLRRAFDNQLLREQEDIIRKYLDSLKPASPVERENFLFKVLAASTIAQSFDRIYFTIFGSQIAVLQFLNDCREVKTAPSDLDPFYTQAASPDAQFYAGYAFEKWIGFLVSWTLVRIDSDSIFITVRGKEFLKYLVDQGFSFLRPR